MQRPETFCREQIKLRYQLDVKVSKRKSGVPLEFLAVAFGWTQFLAPITQPGLQDEQQIRSKGDKMLSSFGDVVLWYTQVSTAIGYMSSRGRSSQRYRYGVISVWFLSWGEGIDSDNKVINTEPLNMPAL